MGDIILLLSLMIMLAGVVGLIKPTLLRLPSRKFAVFILIAGFLGTGVGTALLPDPNAAKNTGSDIATKPSGDNSSEQADNRVKPTDSERAAFERVFRTAMNSFKSCDAKTASASDIVGNLPQTNEVYQAYSAVTDALEDCVDAAGGISTISLSGLTPAQQDEIRGALANCETAYQNKSEGLRGMQTVLDGDGKPSIIKAATDNFERSGTNVTVCVAKLFGTASTMGIDVSKLN